MATNKECQAVVGSNEEDQNVKTKQNKQTNPTKIFEFISRRVQ